MPIPPDRSRTMPAGVTENKVALRRHIKALPTPDWTALTQAFLELPEVEAACTVLLFCGTGQEADTAPVIEDLLARGKTVALPKCLPGRRMEARKIVSRAQLIPGAYGIPEPGEDCPVIERDTIDLILVPALCCDAQGYRLGHGAGYYDRYLAGYSGMTVALCPQAWLQKELPREEFDIPVDMVLCEETLWRGASAPRHSRTD